MVLHFLYNTVGYTSTGSRYIDFSASVRRKIRQAHKSKESLPFKSPFKLISGKEMKAVPFADLDQVLSSDRVIFL